MFAQCDFNFSMHLIPYFGSSEINLLLCTSMFACKRFLDNFHQGRKYSAQIASHQAELRREEKIIDQKSLNISSLQTDYLNIDSISGSGRNSKRAHAVQTNCTFCGGVNHSAENASKG